LLLAREKDRMD